MGLGRLLTGPILRKVPRTTRSTSISRFGHLKILIPRNVRFRPFCAQRFPSFTRRSSFRMSRGNRLKIDGRTVQLGRSHYVASHGQESCWGECGASSTGIIFTNIYTSQTREIAINGDASKVADGPFYRNSRTKIRQIKDGLSKTIFLGEHSAALSDKTWVGVIPGAFTHPRFSSPENGPDARRHACARACRPFGRRVGHHRVSDYPSHQLSHVSRRADVFRASGRGQRLLWRRLRTFRHQRGGPDRLGRVFEH